MSDGCGLHVRRSGPDPSRHDLARDSGSPPCPAAVQNTGLCALWKELVPHLAQLPCPCGHHWRFGVANEFQFPMTLIIPVLVRYPASLTPRFRTNSENPSYLGVFWCSFGYIIQDFMGTKIGNRAYETDSRCGIMH